MTNFLGRVQGYLFGSILPIRVDRGQGSRVYQPPSRKQSVREYSLKLTKLSKYAHFMVADLMARMRKVIFRVSDVLSKERKTGMLVKEMDLSVMT